MERWDNRVKEDHETLESQMSALKEALAIEGETLDRQMILRRFVRVIGPDLELHLRKEEEVLFPALLKLSSEKEESIAFLKQQHGELRLALRRLAGLLCECDCASGKMDWKVVAEAGQQFIELLEDHERKEDRLLIHVLEEGLNSQELMKLAQGFQKVAWATYREAL